MTDEKLKKLIYWQVHNAWVETEKRFRRPQTWIEDKVQLFLRDFKPARAFLGGTWERHQLEENYFAWFWVNPNEKPFGGAPPIATETYKS